MTLEDRVFAALRAKVHKARPADDDPARTTGAGTHCAVCGWQIHRVPGGQGATWVHSGTGAVAAAGGEGGRAQLAPRRDPVDRELFARTAPAWNCVDYPGDGMHYTPGPGGCAWCGMTGEQIAAEHEARGAGNG